MAAAEAAAAAAQPPPAEAAAARQSQHAFETDPGDHAETPLEAYQHVDLLLARLARRLGTTKAALRIYDPYYCEGTMLQHMALLGYETVYNRNEDFYAVKADGRVPEYDILVTNPPFTGDHLDRIFRFVVKSNKPWVLLMPEYVARKAFYLEWLNNQRPKGVPKPFFVAPTVAPYVFTAPDRTDVREMRLKEANAAGAQSGSNDGCTNSSAGGGAGSSNTGVSSSSTPGSSTEVAAAAAAAINKLSLQEAASTTAASTAAAVNSDQVQTANNALNTSPRAAIGDGSSSSTPANAASAAKGTPSAAFDVAAGSFQCVWFVHLGERHQKPVLEWLQQQLEQQEQHGLGQSPLAATAAAAGQAAPASGSVAGQGGGYVVVTNPKEIPQLMAVQKLTPAERRWRKKLAAAGAQAPTEGQPQQQQQHARSSSGRLGGSGVRQQQQQQQRGTFGGRGRGSGRFGGGGRQSGGQQLQDGRFSGGRQGGRGSAAPQQQQQQQCQNAAGCSSSTGQQGGRQPQQG